MQEVAEGGGDMEKPPSPMTMRALQFFNSLNEGKGKRRSMEIRGGMSRKSMGAGEGGTSASPSE